MLAIQDWIHRFEEGGGLRYLKPVLLLLTLGGLVLGYNLRGFRNMATPEAMDSAQLARNIADHKGFSTLVVRPFSMFLVERAKDQKLGPAPVGDTSDRAEIRAFHPDLANAPVYPLLLAGLMSVAPPIKYQATSELGPIWKSRGSFWIYPPDFIISLFNQVLFMAAVLMVFFLARRLFDNSVAWTSAIIFLGTDLFWRFSISGLSTMLLVLIFLALVWCLVGLEKGAREGTVPENRLTLLAGLAGVTLGVGALTRYSFGILILPVLFFTIVFLGKNRVVLSLTIIATFLVVMAPWVVRNYQISHTPFGTAGYAIWEGTSYFTEFRLTRSLKPDLTRFGYEQLWIKLINNTRGILLEDLPKLGGNWVIAFFLAGILVGFRSPAISRMRWFLVACFPGLIAAQALGRTQLSEMSPTINTENLLVILLPAVLIFGVGIFFTLLDQFPFGLPALRLLGIASFCAVMCLPMILTFVTPKTPAVAYPPYYPPLIQRNSNWLKADELMMSDIPCAVAWYGNRQCMWLTLNAQEDFYQVNDYMKPISGLYLTPETMDSRFLTQWVRASEHSWGAFVLETINRREIPPYFPLRKSPTRDLPEQLFLTDTERWVKR